jgi:hypothetical protein
VVSRAQPGLRARGDTLNAIAARTARDIWAVGYRQRSVHAPRRTLIEHWNGTAWHIVPSPDTGSGDNFLFGVTTVTAASAWAVGSGLASTGTRTVALAERWNGSAWVIVPATSPGADYTSLAGVVATGPASAWAVGSQRAVAGRPFRTLAERWNGRSWRTVRTASPGRGDDMLFGVTAVPRHPTSWAVGTATGRALIERYC